MTMKEMYTDLGTPATVSELRSMRGVGTKSVPVSHALRTCTLTDDDWDDATDH